MIVFYKAFVDPTPSIVPSPNSANQQLAGDGPARNCHPPKVPDLRPRRLWSRVAEIDIDLGLAHLPKPRLRLRPGDVQVPDAYDDSSPPDDCNETRVLSLMCALRVNSGTEGCQHRRSPEVFNAPGGPW